MTTSSNIASMLQAAIIEHYGVSVDIKLIERIISKGKAKSVKIPGIDEFIEWARVKHPRWASRARPWYMRFESQDWVDSQGNKVMNVKSKFNTWVSAGWIANVSPETSINLRQVLETDDVFGA